MKALKPLNIAQRVEILLREGVDHPKKWATVHGYEDPIDPVVPNDPRAADEWQRLRLHHLAETNFLFDMLKEMREQIMALEEQLDEQTEVNTKG